jgi:acyl-CoA thioester hydrolase
MSEPIDGHDGPYAAPVVLLSKTVPAKWIDFNGHMNVAYYSFVFDAAIDAFLGDEIGVGAGYAERLRMGPYTLQNHMHYLGELLEGESFHVELQVLDADAKRVHVFMQLFNENDGTVAATAEQLLMNVDLNERRSATYPDWAQKRLQTIASAHANLPRPAQVGAAIGIRRKS